MSPVSQRPPTSPQGRPAAAARRPRRIGCRYCSAMGPCAAPRSRVATGPIAPNATRVMCASRVEVVGLVPLRRVHDDRGARLGVGERVVVREVLEAGGHRRDRQAVGVEVVGLAGDLQAAEVAEVGHVEPDAPRRSSR